MGVTRNDCRLWPLTSSVSDLSLTNLSNAAL